MTSFEWFSNPGAQFSNPEAHFGWWQVLKNFQFQGPIFKNRVPFWGWHFLKYFQVQGPIFHTQRPILGDDKFWKLFKSRGLFFKPRGPFWEMISFEKFSNPGAHFSNQEAYFGRWQVLKNLKTRDSFLPFWLPFCRFDLRFVRERIRAEMNYDETLSGKIQKSHFGSECYCCHCCCYWCCYLCCFSIVVVVDFVLYRIVYLKKACVDFWQFAFLFFAHSMRR